MKGSLWLFGGGFAVLLLIGSLTGWLVAEFRGSQPGDSAGKPSRSLDPAQVESGRAVYLANCSQCHGANGEGQAFWLQRNPDGTLKAPPHDATGHTWHHPDGLLFRIIRDGGSIYETKGFKSNMPAFGDRLDPAEINDVIAYFKSLWGPEERSFQEEVSENDP